MTQSALEKSSTPSRKRQPTPAVPLEIAPQMDAAADAALDLALTPMRAKEMFLYTFLQRAVARYGSQVQAGKKLGVPRQYIAGALERLEVRLAS